MIRRADCIEIILDRFPGFHSRWQEHLDYWEGEEAGLCNDLAEFGHYIRDLIAMDKCDELPAIFELLEEMLARGDEEVDTAVATCVLENLLNYYSAGDIRAESFTHLLGPRSRDYCQGWDSFTGVKTPGVW